MLTMSQITDTAEAVDAEPVAEPADDKTAEAVARIAVAFADLCQMLADVAEAQRSETEKAEQEARAAQEAEARKAARAQEVQTLREGIATLSAQLATMSDQLRKMSDRLAELTTANENENETANAYENENEPTEPTAPNGGGKAGTDDTLQSAEEISNEPTAEEAPAAGLWLKYDDFTGLTFVIGPHADLEQSRAQLIAHGVKFNRISNLWEVSGQDADNVRQWFARYKRKAA